MNIRRTRFVELVGLAEGQPWVSSQSGPATAGHGGEGTKCDPWLALDANLLVRRVSPRFRQLADDEDSEYVGQSLFRLLGQFGVAAADLDRVRSWTALDRSCFVELRQGRIGGRADHFALEIRPAGHPPDWVIRYVAVGWILTDSARPALLIGPKRRRQRRTSTRRRFDECCRARPSVRLAACLPVFPPTILP